MKRFFIVMVLMLTVSIFAQGQSADFGINANVNNTERSGGEKDVRTKAILDNLQAIEETYLIKLPKRDYLEASMLLEEIREILLGKENTETNVNTSVTTETQSTQNVNLNLNISGFENPVTPPPVVEANPQAVPQQPVMQIEETNKPMDSGAFMRLMSNIEAESFADDQMRYVRTAANSHYFSVSQVEQLIDLFDFADEKLGCLRVVYPRVVDKDRSFSIISKFTFEDDKREAEAIINQ